MRGLEEIVRVLLQKEDIDFNVTETLSGCTALHNTSHEGHTQIVQMVTQGGHTEMVRMLLQIDVIDVHQSEESCPALHLALRNVNL